HRAGARDRDGARQRLHLVEHGLLPGVPARAPAVGDRRGARPESRRRRDDGRGRLRHARRARVALPAARRGGRAAPAPDRGGLRPRAGATRRALRACASAPRRNSAGTAELLGFYREPQEYGYVPGYYAVFFYDPDGIKLEIV